MLNSFVPTLAGKQCLLTLRRELFASDIDTKGEGIFKMRNRRLEGTTTLPVFHENKSDFVMRVRFKITKKKYAPDPVCMPVLNFSFKRLGTN